jgi:hypothetical protein
VHQDLERPLGVLLFEDVAHDLVRLAGVDHQRQAGLARRRHMGAEHVGLHLARAEVVVEVETRLADADDLGTACQLDQALGRQVDVILGLVRVGADRAPDVVMGHGDGMDGFERRNLVADGDHQFDAGLAGAADHRLAILVVLMGVQVYVAVDEHAVTWPPERRRASP